MKIKKYLKILTLISALISINFCGYVFSNNLNISSNCAVLIENNTGKILFKKNPSQVVYAASLIKLMNILQIFEALNEGKLNLKEKITIKENLPNTQGSNINFKKDEIVTLEDLLKSIIMVSADDACIHLANYIYGSEGKYVFELNELAKKMGFNNTIIKNSFGKDIDGNVTSAIDIANMTKKIFEYDYANKYISNYIDHIRNGKTQLVNSNKFLKSYPNCYGIKTGTSEKAGSCGCICSKKDNLDLTAVILGSEDIKSRNNDINALLDYGFSNYHMQNLTLPSEIPSNLKVKKGISDTVKISVVNTEAIPIFNDENKKISSKVVLNENIEAPLKKGDKVGKVVFYQNEDVIHTCDIISNEDINKVNYISIFKKLIKKFF